jgi:HNH endonuclease
MKETDRERVMRSIAVDERGCWIWQLARFKRGYGMVRSDGKNKLAHRFAFEACVAPIPEGALVCHHCDVPACCNPEHLFLGDHRANMADSARKGRRRGSKHPRAAFTEQLVADVRAEYARGGVRQVDIAERFGVSRTTVGSLLCGRNWGHV